MLYELLAGCAPFEARDAFEMVRQHIQEPVPPLADKVGSDVPPELIAFVHRCLAKAPADRFADGNDALAGFWKLELDDEGPIWFTKPGGEPADAGVEGAASPNVTIALSDSDLDFEEIPPENSIILQRPPERPL
jgi:serine/threonine protein kinase